MASYNAGDCFLIKEDIRDKQHLRIVLCNPSGNPLTVLTVLVNTAHEHNMEHNFVLEPNVHPFINRTSVVNYRSMKTIYVAGLDAAEISSSWEQDVNNRIYVQHTPINPELLKRIIDGALQSKVTPKDMKLELRRRLGLQGG